MLPPLDWIIIRIHRGGGMAAGSSLRRYVPGGQAFAAAGREMDVDPGIASLAAAELEMRPHDSLASGPPALSSPLNRATAFHRIREW